MTVPRGLAPGSGWRMGLEVSGLAQPTGWEVAAPASLSSRPSPFSSPGDPSKLEGARKVPLCPASLPCYHLRELADLQLGSLCWASRAMFPVYFSSYDPEPGGQNLRHPTWVRGEEYFCSTGNNTNANNDN